LNEIQHHLIDLTMTDTVHDCWAS